MIDRDEDKQASQQEVRIGAMGMTFGYVIADAADQNTFREAVGFIENALHFQPIGKAVEDVDGSMWQKFSDGTKKLRLICDCQIDYVAIESDTDLPIKCLHNWSE